ncbi:unnamed protein product [Nezara viridula]|uniref:Uncharacterized protein n=1 Tax=Nezara viridula TaxID=85310 RepID=A0A9P0E048_NEZVI|nr:unnamed protein product [Nezara viridula]
MLGEGLDQLPQPEQSLCICEMERGLGKMCADFWLFNASLAQRNGHNAKLAWILPKFSISDGYATNRGKQPITFHQLVKISPPPSPTLALSFVLYDSGASKLGQIPIKLRQNAGICLDLPVVWAQGNAVAKPNYLGKAGKTI